MRITFFLMDRDFEVEDWDHYKVEDNGDEDSDEYESSSSDEEKGFEDLV